MRKNLPRARLGAEGVGSVGFFGDFKMSLGWDDFLQLPELMNLKLFLGLDQFSGE